MRKSNGIKIFYMIMIISIIQISSLVNATTTVVFSPTDDTMIKNETPNSPFGLSWDLIVRNAYDDDYKKNYEIDSLINFNVFSIPSSATIHSASIHIYYYNWSGTNPAGRHLSMYLTTSSWMEKYVSWRTQPSYVTTSSSSSVVPDSKGQWMTWNVTNDVQYLIKERAYYGWIITDANNWIQPDISMIYFRSKEYGNYIPYLEVTYTISETNKAPISAFTLTPLDPKLKDSIQFTDTSYDPDGTITEWLWNFGDGNSSTIRNPIHTFTQSGQYTVTLKVTDSDRTTNSTTGAISISKSTPGFEIIIVISALALAFLWKRKSKK